MGRVKNIFVHCSSSPWGDVLTFDEWHKQRGWRGIGYHFVVLNGRPAANVDYWDFLDGEVQPGRSLDDDPIFEVGEVGAHVAGRNHESIGVCLVGKKEFTEKQLESAKQLILRLVKHFGLTVNDVKGHYEDPATTKTCPNIPMSYFRGYLEGGIGMGKLQKAIQDHVKDIY